MGDGCEVGRTDNRGLAIRPTREREEDRGEVVATGQFGLEDRKLTDTSQVIEWCLRW